MKVRPDGDSFESGGTVSEAVRDHMRTTAARRKWLRRLRVIRKQAGRLCPAAVAQSERGARA